MGYCGGEIRLRRHTRIPARENVQLFYGRTGEGARRVGGKEFWKRFHTLPVQEAKPGHRSRNSKAARLTVCPSFQPATHLRWQGAYNNSKTRTRRKRVRFQRRILDEHVQRPSESGPRIGTHGRPGGDSSKDSPRNAQAKLGRTLPSAVL